MLSAAPDLPVNACLPACKDTLARGRNLLLVAPPGAGKTTLLPLALLDAPWRHDATILVLEPRRLAVRAAAHRMADLMHDTVGNLVGYRTRIEQSVSRHTRIEVVTTGLLVRRLLSDPGLAGTAAVIVDEIHERSLDADLALALLLDLQRQLRPELRLIAMSATADTARLAALMDAELVESDGRAYPVTFIHAARDVASLRELPAAMVAAIRATLPTHDGDLLCFLPGMGDIRRTESALPNVDADILALHGDLPPAEQHRALSPGRRRKIVLATSIAETSLTVPGVRIVIDGGYRRAPRHDPATGLTRLTTQRVSRAAAAQRAGRAGREAPGLALRLWTTATERALPEHDRPEIQDAELSALLLACAAWGTPPEELSFPDAPSPGRLAAGRSLLTTLGALDDGGLTGCGRQMAELGAHPRLAAMMLGATTPAEKSLAADLAAILEERDPISARGRSYPHANLTLRVALLQDAALPMDVGDIDRGALARIRAGAAQYRRRLRIPPDTDAAGDTAALLAHAFPDRIAQARGEPGRFRLSAGGSATLSPQDPLARARLLVVASLDATHTARIVLAAALDPADLPASLVARIQISTDMMLDPVTGAVLARRRRRLGALLLDDRTEPADPVLRASLLAQHAATHLGTMNWTAEARQFQARVSLMHGLDTNAWPDLSDPALAATTAVWLEPALHTTLRLSDLQDLVPLLHALLSPSQRHHLDRLLPMALALPNGAARIDYCQPVPQAAARAQVFYGVRTTPALADGRIPLTIALLSPANRPIAITADLAAFWITGWPDARKEMRGRYPRHDWPERP